MDLDEYFKDLEAELESHRQALEKISVTVDNYNLSAKVIQFLNNELIKIHHSFSLMRLTLKSPRSLTAQSRLKNASRSMSTTGATSPAVSKSTQLGSFPSSHLPRSATFRPLLQLRTR